MSDTGRRSRRGTVPVVAGVLLLAATGLGVAVKISDQPLPDAGALPAPAVTATPPPESAGPRTTGSPTASPQASTGSTGSTGLAGLTALAGLG